MSSSDIIGAKKNLQFLGLTIVTLAIMGVTFISVRGAQERKQTQSSAAALKGRPGRSPAEDPHIYMQSRSAPPGYDVPIDFFIDSPNFQITHFQGDLVTSGGLALPEPEEASVCVPSFLTPGHVCHAYDVEYTQYLGPDYPYTCVENLSGRYWLRIPTTAPVGSQFTVDLSNIYLEADIAPVGSTPTRVPVPYTYTGGVVNVVASNPGVCMPDAPSRVAKSISGTITAFTPSIDYKATGQDNTMKIYVYGKNTDDADFNSAVYYGMWQNGVWTQGPGGTSNYLVLVWHAYEYPDHYGNFPAVLPSPPPPTPPMLPEEATITVTTNGTQTFTIYASLVRTASGPEQMLALYATEDGTTWHAHSAHVQAVVIPTLPPLTPTRTLEQKIDIAIGRSPSNSIFYYGEGAGYYPEYDGYLGGFCGNLPIYAGAPNCGAYPTITPGGPTITPSITWTPTPTIGGPTPTVTPPILTLSTICPGGVPTAHLSWTAVSGATGYEVYKCFGTGCDPSYWGQTTNTFWDDDVVGNGSTYGYKVRAVFSPSGYSPFSTTEYLTISCATASPTPTRTPTRTPTPTNTPVPSATPPATPTLAPAPELSFGVNCRSPIRSVQMVWKPYTGAVNYDLQRCQGSGCSTYTPLVTGWTSTSYNDQTVAEDTTYGYRLRAYLGGSTYTNWNSFSATVNCQ